MKHIIFYVSVSVIAIFMVILIRSHDEKSTPMLLTVQTDYTYLYQASEDIRIPLYLNLKEHPLTDIHLYQQTSLQNEAGTKKIELHLTSIQKGHKEHYLNDVYQVYELIFEMPYLASYYYLEDAYLSIYLENDDTYLFYVGRFEIDYEKGSSEALDWYELYGFKKENDFTSRLHIIHLAYHKMDVMIETIKIGQHQLVNHHILDDHLSIEISYEAYLLYQCPIYIYFVDGSMQTISNFRFFMDYQILKESSLLIHHYGLS